MKKLLLKELSRYPIGTYADIIYRNALLHGDRLAFASGGRKVTFSDFNGQVNSVIHALQSMGLKKGDGIGILSWNGLGCTDVTGAAMKGGFIVSPINPRMQKEELDFLINYSEVKALFVGAELVDVVNQLRPKLPGVKHYIAFDNHA